MPHLLTRHTQLSLRCSEQGKLLLSYLGARLRHPLRWNRPHQSCVLLPTPVS